MELTTKKIQFGNNVGQIGVRSNRIIACGTSILGNFNSMYEAFCARYGGNFRRLPNGANPGQYAQNIADHVETNAVVWTGGLALVCAAANDMGGGSIGDIPAPGTGSVSNALYYVPRIVAKLRAAGVFVLLVTEIPSSLTTAPRKTNIVAWNNWLKNAYYPSLADPGVGFCDAAAVLTDASGNELIAPIQTTATGTSGTNTIVVASAAGISLGMYAYGNGTNIPTSTIGEVRVIGISGTTITLSSNLTATMTAAAVAFYVDMQDPVHTSTVGSQKIADRIFTDLSALNALTSFGASRPLTSSTAANGVDNLITNGLLEGAVTSGAGTGWSSTFLANSVVSDAAFWGKAQQASIAPGDPTGILQTSSISVRAYRKRLVRLGIKLKVSGFLEAGMVYNLTGTFDVSPPALPATFTSSSATSNPFSFTGVAFSGVIYFTGEGIVPDDASTLRIIFATTSAFPAGAPGPGVVLAGEAYCYDVDDVRRSYWSKDPVRTLTASTTLDATDGVVLANSTGATTMTLPAAATARNRSIVVKNINTGTVTVQANGAELIDGANTQTISVQWVAMRMISNGTSWFITGKA